MEDWSQHWCENLNKTFSFSKNQYRSFQGLCLNPRLCTISSKSENLSNTLRFCSSKFLQKCFAFPIEKLGNNTKAELNRIFELFTRILCYRGVGEASVVFRIVAAWIRRRPGQVGMANDENVWNLSIWLTVTVTFTSCLCFSIRVVGR